MAVKNFLPQFQIITAGDMSLASLTSQAVDIRYLDNISIQIIMSGAPVGTWAIQGSVSHLVSSPSNTVTSQGTWTTITTAAVSAAGDLLIDLNQASYPWIRLVYTKASGTGTANAFISAKAV